MSAEQRNPRTPSDQPAVSPPGGPGTPSTPPPAAPGISQQQPPPAPTPQGAPGLPVPWEPVLTAAFGRPHGYEIDDYLSRGGYEALRKVLREMAPADVIKVVSDSKLVGRGGAGFPTGLKWGGTARNPKPRHLVVNADESEPGTFGNRYCMDADPHGLLEGMLICCYAVDIQQAYIYIRGENLRGYERLEYAIKQAYEKGFLGRDIAGKSGFHVDMAITRGAGAYICGEETALMESLEGRRAQPRIRPPFPVDVGGGLFGRPTVVNNVETLMDVPHIINRGAEWFASVGNPASPGPKVYTISGHVNKPGVYELPMGVSLRDLIFKYADGMQRDQQVKAVSPGALACQILPGTNLDIPMDTATLTRPPYFNKLGPVGFGAGGIIVYGEETNMVDLMVQLSGFFARESCGKCVPCREGTHWMVDMWRRIQAGGGTVDDINTLEDVAARIAGKKTLCALGDFAAGPVWSAIQHFRPEFEEYVRRGTRALERERELVAV